MGGSSIAHQPVPWAQQTQLAHYASQMGAAHTYDLTPDVTHLVVGEYDTKKYRYVAKNRPDVLPMTMDWIEAVRDRWINDQEIDMPALEQEHRRPVLQDLRFSMTGCDDRKSWIESPTPGQGLTLTSSPSKLRRGWRSRRR